MLKTELQRARTRSSELARPDSSELRTGLQRPTPARNFEPHSRGGRAGLQRISAGVRLWGRRAVLSRGSPSTGWDCAFNRL